jgi:hypothetical protein
MLAPLFSPPASKNYKLMQAEEEMTKKSYINFLEKKRLSI